MQINESAMHASVTLRNEGKKSSKTEERIAKLNEIGFKWTLRARLK